MNCTQVGALLHIALTRAPLTSAAAQVPLRRHGLLRELPTRCQRKFWGAIGALGPGGGGRWCCVALRHESNAGLGHCRSCLAPSFTVASRAVLQVGKPVMLNSAFNDMFHAFIR